MWKCVRDNACCVVPDAVVMTHQERAEIEHAAQPGSVLRFVPDADSHFVRLVAHPCPLFDGKGCTVYAVRPYSCRRFACLRDDVTTEPFVDGFPVPQNRSDRRTLVVLQRHGQKWARSHGWSES